MGKALYRKYRSRSLEEILDQEHITKTLQNAIKQGKISHAYLFTGPKGVGKTSIARIIAHEINNLPYDDDSYHVDIIEIDAASNRRIDEIRDLRERVNIAPSSLKYKVYIIDEVHMLTKEAFNALLKTLEEPPNHVVFILATTDAHKLPETIISRTQRYSFKPVNKSKVAKHLRNIADLEKIDINDEAIELLAEHGEGSFRDSISLLDQASSTKDNIALMDVQNLLGIPSKESIEKLISDIASGESVQSIINKLENLYNQGYQPAMISKQISANLRNNLINNSLQIENDKAIKLLDQLLIVPSSNDPSRYLELVLIENTMHNIASQPSEKKMPDQPKPTPKKQESIQASKPIASTQNKMLDLNTWKEVLSELKDRHNTLYGIVRMAEPKFISDKVLELNFSFAFHQKRCDEVSNRTKLSNIILELTGNIVEIHCILNPKSSPPKIKITSSKAKDDSLETISNIFGDAELLES